jgi:hypothetical protein
MRPTLAECRSVSANGRLASDANHTGVATPLPSRLKVVTLRYRPRKSTSKSTAGRWTGQSLVWVAMASPRRARVSRAPRAGTSGNAGRLAEAVAAVRGGAARSGGWRRVGT